MPLTQFIDHERNVSVISVTGRLSVADTVAFIKEEAAKAEEDGKRLPLLIDATQADDHKFLITEVDMFARLAEKMHRNNGHRREALVAGSEMNLGVLSLFKQFSANSENTQVFTDVDEAIAWLNSSG